MTGDDEVFIAGVEVGPSIIRVGIFSQSLELLGKTKLTTKPERGSEAVIDRIARCIAYAADECDFPAQAVRQIGLGLPGQVCMETGRVIRAPHLGWLDVALKAELEQRLMASVVVGNIHQLGALGIFLREAQPSPGRFAALFPAGEIGCGLIVDGRIHDLAGFPPEAVQGDSTINPAAVEFRHYRGRDFRKALRKGSQPVRQFLNQVAINTGHVAARIIREFSPAMIALGGGVMDEMRDEILATVDATVRADLGTNYPLQLVWITSHLGDLAGITGAAASTLAPTVPSNEPDVRSQSGLLAVQD